jgi:tetratricopeptide (TPR) repeat protein
MEEKPMAKNCRIFAALAAATLASAGLAARAAAQPGGVTLPPSGGNQRQSIAQGIGLVRVSIDYSSPHVHSPAGVDRRGKIWGKDEHGKDNLIPYGLTNLGFGTCGDQCPWRGGANENTVFTTTHDIKVQGQPLAAGSYGLHFIADPQEWTVIFSKNYTSWGSFFYDAKEDALRVKAKPAKSEYHEDLTYEFRDRKLDHATAVLRWEDLELPIAITVPNTTDLYVENMARELRSTAGFGWQGWSAAVQYCLQNKTHPDLALIWAKRAVDPNIGQENFDTLAVLAEAEDANGHAEEAKKDRERAIHHATATPFGLHAYGRQLIGMKKTAEAMQVFEANAKLHPETWPVHVGLARGHAALGHRKEAIAEARLGLPQAPNEASRKNLEQLIDQLEQGKEIN